MQDLVKIVGKLKSTSGSVIRAHRRNFKITLKELANATGIAESNLSLIENDKIELGVRRASLLGAALGIEPAFILFPNDFESPYEKEVRVVRKRAKKLFLEKKKKADSDEAA